MENSSYCYAHGGKGAFCAPTGNANALKHGFYGPIISEDEYADLLTCFLNTYDPAFSKNTIAVRGEWMVLSN